MLGVGLSSVKQWDSNRIAPDGVLTELRGLHAVIRRASEEAFQAMSSAPIGAEIEIGYPADDHEAQSLGFPCVGAWRAMCAASVARLPHRVVLVPRGSTPATAALRCVGTVTDLAHVLPRFEVSAGGKSLTCAPAASPARCGVMLRLPVLFRGGMTRNMNIPLA